MDEQLQNVLASLFVAILGGLAAMVARLIHAKVKHEYLRGVLLRLNDAVFTAVGELMQTLASDWRKRSLDGKLTADDKAKLKAEAIRKVRDYLGNNGRSELMRILGLDDEAKRDALLEGHIEAAVHDLKAGRTAPGSPAAKSLHLAA